jgi:protein phosphatase 1L
MRLDIPLCEITTFGKNNNTTPCGEGRRDFLEREGEEFGVYCKRGRREAMEDRYSALVNVHGNPKQAFFGVFDGHGGSKAAEFAAENLHKNMLDEIVKRGDENIQEAVKFGYLNTDSQFLNEDTRGGSCCVSALIQNGNLVVSNAGDCRAVVSERGIAQALTSDHRPSREDERNRIQTLGGYVDLCNGVWRVQGSLAVTRGFGDRSLKQWIVAEPETKIVKIKPEHEFLILASDGLWDKVSNQEVVDIARPLCMHNNNPENLAACKQLAELAASRGSVDDISVMVIRLRPFFDGAMISHN